MADFIIIGDQVGWTCLISAATPAMCGVAMLVPAQARAHKHATERLATQALCVIPALSTKFKTLECQQP